MPSEKRSETLVRRFVAFALAAGVIVSLSACASSESSASDAGAAACDSAAPNGNSSSTVTSPQKFGTKPEVSFPQPLISKRVEATVLHTGDGVLLQTGQPVLVEATILSGADGSVLQQTAYEQNGGSLFTLGDTALPELGEGLECVPLGSRVAVVAPAAAAAAEGAPPASTVFVVDLIRAYKAKADGADQIPQNGMPAVVTAPDGTPGITIPNEKAPSDFREATLKAGSGKKITDSANVVAKYTAVDWESKTVSESTWTTGGAAILTLADAATVSTGLKEALVGQRIGSQVIAVLPPDLNGVGGQPGSSTLVYVVDILGVIS